MPYDLQQSTAIRKADEILLAIGIGSDFSSFKKLAAK